MVLAEALLRVPWTPHADSVHRGQARPGANFVHHEAENPGASSLGQMSRHGPWACRAGDPAPGETPDGHDRAAGEKAWVYAVRARHKAGEGG